VSSRAAFAHPDFRLYELGRFLTTVALQMQSVAVGWQVYSLTGDPLHLGWVGLAQFLPMIVLSLATGHVADRFERRRILFICVLVFAMGTAALGWLSSGSELELPMLYGVLVLLGVGRAFHGPAAAAILPSLVPERDFTNAVVWNSIVWQSATVLGPALGGFAYGAFGPVRLYAIATGLLLLSAFCTWRLRPSPFSLSSEPTSFTTLLAGLTYVWKKRVMLGVISLDLFAVLLGGAVALLPALARDHLHVGPTGLGLLRGAPAAGAAVMALWLAYRPLVRHAGRVLLASVAVFGAGTIVLGFSRVFLLSALALFVLGAADMISIFVRKTLVQLGTPNEMRGRVSAVNLVFISASNELGEFESGVTAAWLGVVPAVIAGGVGTMLVVALWAVWFPSLRRVDRLDKVTPETV
jgi:MFS family permease